MTTGNCFARFAVESNKINEDRVHPSLFTPTKDGTLSVETINGRDCDSIIAAGTRVAEQRRKTLYGWAKITRRVIEDTDLIVCVDNNPHEGHATIGGWPKERNIRRDKQKILATACCHVFLGNSLAASI